MESNATMTSSNLEPREDMEFDSHEAAYEFYKEYAKSVGFGTAKLSSRRSRASKEFIDAKFSCIRYGNKQQSDDAINPRPSPKIGCKASLHVKRKEDGKWYVHNFVKDHNHELLPAQAHFFQSHRDLDLLKNDVRLRKRKLLASMSKQFNVYQKVGCLENLKRSQHAKGRSLSLEIGDAQMLLDLLMQMQEEDPKFFYALDLNEEQRLRNVFWVDAKGQTDYSYFNDVVSLDTTYARNNYKIPLVLLVGVNHHIQPLLLGCALIADESVHTFLWLVQTWLIAVGGQPPQVLLTDENSALKTAIAELLPSTRHCFCFWHIFEKIPKKLDHINIWLDDFMEKFNKCIFKSWTEEQFEKRWLKLLEKFELRDDEWLRSIYVDRVHWVPVFMRNISFAGLSANSRSECLNSYFDKYVNEESSLGEFLEQYKLLSSDRYEEEAKAEFDAWHEAPELKSPSPFEKQMSWVYTHEILKKFQVEVLGAAACHLKKEKEDATGITYTVKDFESNQDFTVEWNESSSEICCLCRLFEYHGFLCRHAIVVLQMSGVFNIPSKYVLQRWTNASLSRHSISGKLDEVQAKVRRYNGLCRRALILAEEGSLSIDSYNVAVSAMRDAFQQCYDGNSSFEKDLRPNSSIYLINCNGFDSQGSHSRLCDGELDRGSSEISTVPMRPEFGKETISSNMNVNTQENAVLDQDITAVGSEHGFTQMETPNTRPALLHDMFPVPFHTSMSSMIRGTGPGQFQHAIWQQRHADGG
ncbi:protein FAR1-RELATED SEQUENCE 4-like [Amaranthus tricolor]|uniref:protein FAR1-RELATED SEQUENCE 4-like n=1 Tax=Amaranthus tricolor TaxID=29722 RepID=UPI002586FDC9|nr:protein FAR1-RELATED SEQUENCE 4-like [Amaranthus tricolor]XP_057534105.1 protein FAR1-RELATED SEQUENCE 4-like [Amaranthus tricolor]XP_057534106.1 protein FAR1-RELATED SEQUENCE 4-like [Amaranthus tricolor]